MNNLDANRRRGSLLFAQFRASAPQRAVVAATRAGNLEQVRELLNAGARVPPNAILLAAENDHGGILEALLDRHPAGLEFLTTPHALKQHVERGRIQVLLTVMRAAPGTDAIKTMAKETIVACDAALLSVMLIKVGHEPFLGGALDPLRRPDFYQKARAPTVMEFVWNFVRPHIQDPQDRLLMVTVAFRSRNPERFKEALRDLDPRWFTHETFRSVVVNAVEAYDPDRNTAYVDALRVHGVVATLDELSFKKNCRFDIFLKLLAFMDGPLDQYIMVYTPPKQPWSYIGDLLADLKEHAPELLKTWWIHHGRQVSRCLFGHEEVAFMMEAFPDARFPPEDQDLVEAATRGDADAVANLLVTHQEGSVLRAAVLAAARAGHVGVLSHLG